MSTDQIVILGVVVFYAGLVIGWFLAAMMATAKRGDEWPRK